VLWWVVVIPKHSRHTGRVPVVPAPVPPAVPPDSRALLLSLERLPFVGPLHAALTDLYWHWP
jgi:hypothetical protein